MIRSYGYCHFLVINYLTCQVKSLPFKLLKCFLLKLFSGNSTTVCNQMHLTHNKSKTVISTSFRVIKQDLCFVSFSLKRNYKASSY